MKVTDLKLNEVIHCPTLEDAKAICKLMHQEGLRWNTGDCYLTKNLWEICRENTCYHPKMGTYRDINSASKQSIYPASKFLETQTIEEQVKKLKQDVIDFMKRDDVQEVINKYR